MGKFPFPQNSRSRIPVHGIPIPASRCSRGTNSREISWPGNKFWGIFWQLLPLPGSRSRWEIGKSGIPQGLDLGMLETPPCYPWEDPNPRRELQDGHGNPGYPRFDSLHPAGCIIPRKTLESSSRTGMGGSDWNFSGYKGGIYRDTSIGKVSTAEKSSLGMFG